MLVDKTVLVTGASSGIGRACAVAFAEAGARLVVCARRAERLQELAAELQTDVHVLPIDVGDREAVAEAVGSLPSDFAEVDILVNNAGFARGGLAPLHEGDPATWEQMLDTNVLGVLTFCRALVPAMVERGRGHVINIGSIAGRETYPGGAVYCATKAAVDRITKGLRLDLLGTGVRVSTVDPGMVETEFSIVRYEGDRQRAADVYRGMTPLAPADVAEAVVWVADRPAHVQVSDVVILATDQSSATRVARA